MYEMNVLKTHIVDSENLKFLWDPRMFNIWKYKHTTLHKIPEYVVYGENYGSVTNHNFVEHTHNLQQQSLVCG